MEGQSALFEGTGSICFIEIRTPLLFLSQCPMAFLVKTALCPSLNSLWFAEFSGVNRPPLWTWGTVRPIQVACGHSAHRTSGGNPRAQCLGQKAAILPLVLFTNSFHAHKHNWGLIFVLPDATTIDYMCQGLPVQRGYPVIRGNSTELQAMTSMWTLQLFHVKGQTDKKEVSIFVEMTASNCQEDLRVLVNNGTLEEYV